MVQGQLPLIIGLELKLFSSMLNINAPTLEMFLRLSDTAVRTFNTYLAKMRKTILDYEWR